VPRSRRCFEQAARDVFQTGRWCSNVVNGTTGKAGKPPSPGRDRPGHAHVRPHRARRHFATNALLDNVLIAYGASCDARAALYANGRDLKDPLLSPIYGDVHGFPPTILTTGTRDLLLGNTVRMPRKLRLAGVEAVLQAFEGMAHAQYFRDPAAPESKEVFEEIAGFFDHDLGK
jgi:epsilon-lactone hydrolase